MIVAAIMAKKLKYKSETQNSFKEGIKVVLDAVPSLLLILIVIGGILKGVFTATEGSAIAVVYSLFLSFVYKEMKLSDLPKIFLSSAQMTAIVIFYDRCFFNYVMGNVFCSYSSKNSRNVIGNNR